MRSTPAKAQCVQQRIGCSSGAWALPLRMKKKARRRNGMNDGTREGGEDTERRTEEERKRKKERERKERERRERKEGEK